MGDTLLKFKDGNRASFYIPDINWNAVKADLNSNSSHLLTRAVTADQTEEADQSTLRDKLLNLLGVSAADFSTQVPFTGTGWIPSPPQGCHKSSGSML